jgi:hypothetical protein
VCVCVCCVFVDSCLLRSVCALFRGNSCVAVLISPHRPGDPALLKDAFGCVLCLLTRCGVFHVPFVLCFVQTHVEALAVCGVDIVPAAS